MFCFVSYCFLEKLLKKEARACCRRQVISGQARSLQLFQNLVAVHRSAKRETHKGYHDDKRAKSCISLSTSLSLDRGRHAYSIHTGREGETTPRVQTQEATRCSIFAFAATTRRQAYERATLRIARKLRTQVSDLVAGSAPRGSTWYEGTREQ